MNENIQACSYFQRVLMNTICYIFRAIFSIEIKRVSCEHGKNGNKRQIIWNGPINSYTYCFLCKTAKKWKQKNDIRSNINHMIWGLRRFLYNATVGLYDSIKLPCTLGVTNHMMNPNANKYIKRIFSYTSST